jgi:predicted ATPase with chaperone activity
MNVSLDKIDLVKSKAVSTPEHRPRSIAEVGIRESLMEDIALKALYLSGPFTVLDLAEQTHIGFEVAEQLFNRLRGKLLCEVAGMVANVPQIVISSHGRSRALELLSQNQYSGSMPVSLESYVTQVRRQSVRKLDIGPADVQRAFGHMVLDAEMLSQFGMALNSGAAVFLYGPPGTGKTATAETLSRVLAEDEVWIPYAVEAGGQIISVYDPVIHGPVQRFVSDDQDRRWIRCRRPTVIVGGELTVEMLDLQFNPVSKYYDCPPQMKANNGVLIIDDFGRQRVSPEELLNRWVVPLDRRIEFLTLIGGRKIEIPFEMLVVFATNKDPATMLEPAFMRRIQTKIRIGSPSDEEFCEIFRRVAAENGLTVDPTLLVELITLIRDTLRQELRQCYPRDLIDQICWKARYEGREPTLDRASLRRAVNTYFLQSV